MDFSTACPARSAVRLASSSGGDAGPHLGSGGNLPVSPDQLRAALGSDQVKHLASTAGVSSDAALKLLSEHLPGVIDKASPDGALPSS
jgi:uncharacterized protein YidB (DUF937 family)